MALGEYLAGEVAEDFRDGLLTRREALRRLLLLGLGVPTATTLLAACSGGDDGAGVASGNGSTSTSPAAQSTTTTAPPADASRAGQAVRFQGSSGEIQGSWAAASTAGIPSAPKGAVLVIHENRGLTPHFVSLVGRLAAAGYSSLCVDLLSPEGGTASVTDPAGAAAALARAPVTRLIGDLRSGVDELGRRSPSAMVGVVGFCFGGGMAWQLVQDGDTRLAAVVPFYGPAPDPADFSRSRAAVLGVYAELDERVNASRARAQAALQQAGLTHEIRTYPGVDHGFFNDTGARYEPEAAQRANADMLGWFGQHLA